MEKNTKKILVFGLFGLFVLVFAMQFVAAENPFDPVQKWFENTRYGSPEFSSSVARWLFVILISIVVYSIASQIPGLSSIFTGSKEYLGVIFSLVVGFLSMAYITPDEVYAMMMSYTAMGFVIGGALPFIILLFFTLNLAKDSEGDGGVERYSKKSIAVLMWVFFVAFMGYKTFIGIGEYEGVYSFLTYLIFFGSIVIAIFIPKIFNKIWKSLRGEKHQKAGDVVEDAAENIQQQAGMQNILGSSVRSPYS